LASTGSGGRRAFLVAAAAGPLSLTVSGAEAADYGSAAEVFAAIERLEAEVDARLAAVERAVPGAAAFAASVRRDRARHRAERARLRARLRAGSAEPAGPGPEADATLDALRASQQALVHAHAEGLPALGDRAAVDLLAVHMVDLARQLAVIDLWIELEEQRG
jgi:hypothetical protein